MKIILGQLFLLVLTATSNITALDEASLAAIEHTPCPCASERNFSSIWQTIVHFIQSSADAFDQTAREQLCKLVLQMVDKEYTSCMIDPAGAELIDVLRDIASAMRDDQVYTLLLNNNSELADQETWVQANSAIRAVFGDRLYVHTTEALWPTMRELKGKVVVFLDEGLNDAIAIPAGQLCIHASNDWIFQTEYSYEPGERDLRDFSHNQSNSTDLYPVSATSNELTQVQSPDGYYCGISRGGNLYSIALAEGNGQTNKMYLIHHYMTEGLAGKEYLADAINIKSRILERITACHGQIRFWPTFVQFDFVNSEVTNAIAALNQQVLQMYQAKDPSIASLGDLRYNQVIHLIAHNGPSNKSPGYYATHTPPSKYKAYVDRLWFACLVKYKILTEEMLIKVAVNDQTASLADQVQKYGVTGFKIPMVADPKAGDEPDSQHRILWACHGLDKSDLIKKIKEAFGVN